jgi:PAS domain S-box-containing protein
MGNHNDIELTEAAVAASIRETQHGFRELVEAAPDAILEIDERGRILLVNEEAERLFGCRRTKFLGRLIEEFVPERFRSEHMIDRERYGTRPVKRPMGAGLDLWARRSDGSEFPVDIKLSPVQTEDGLRVMSFAISPTAKQPRNRSGL